MNPLPAQRPANLVLATLAPGIALCGAVTLVAAAMQWAEQAVFNHLYVEALVIAILLGALIRTAWNPDDRFKAGIDFCGRTILEIAVALIGGTISFSALSAMGAPLLVGILTIVALSLLLTFAVSRMLGLPTRLSILIAAGNSICGNSAIAALAPIIGAGNKEVVSAVAFTAVLGVVVVLVLPSLVPLIGLSETQYGVVAGLTVYAVPQVLAATVPIGAISNQVGTVVKLARVLLLGPLVLFIAIAAGRLRAAREPGRRQGGGVLQSINMFVPYFIIGFFVMVGLRSAGVLPVSWLEPLATLTKWLTTISMAALGLGVDLRSVTQAGVRISAAVVISLLVLGLMALALIRIARIA